MRKVIQAFLWLILFSSLALAVTPPSVPSTCGSGSSICACANSAGSGTANTVSCTINSVTGTVGILVHTVWYQQALDGQTIAISDSSSGGGTSDTFSVGNVCYQTAIPTYFIACSNYVCKSTLSAGNFTLTSTASPTGGEYYGIDAEIISGTTATGCYDQSGGWSAGGSPFYTYTGCVNTGSCPNGGTGDISVAEELAIGFITNGAAPTPVSPFAQIQVLGGNQSAYVQNPTVGSALEVQWTSTGANYVALIDTFKPVFPPSTKIRHSVKQQ